MTTSGPPIRFMRLRRWTFFGLVTATTLLATGMMYDIVRAAGVTALEIVILALFVPTFGWIAFAFWNATIGFVIGLLRRDPSTLERLSHRGGPEGPIVTRTALVMPAHNEDTSRVMAGLAAITHSLESTALAGHFDVHLLSDTTDANIAAEEEAAWQALRERAPRPGRLHYRRRPTNEGRKAGNIGEFCDRHADEYDFMVVLDADSVMRGDTLVELVRRMQAEPDLGLIQTVPIPARQETLFGRFVQFASALYSPMLALGQAFWQTETANYWGHNAIVRLRPFAEHARLPVLPGSPPLGGRILSHDFVEAALLRRAGWKVRLEATFAGSYEEVPTNVLDYAKRDRRWAQGSLQHLRLLPEPGLHALSRLHFTMGAMGYLASVLWLMMLLASTAYVLLPGLSVNPLIGGTPDAPSLGALADVRAVVPLLVLTGVVLFVPKAMGFVLALVQRRAAFGGAPTLVAGTVLEGLFSILVAPIMMLLHTRFVLGILAGRDVDWGAQPRADREVGWHEAFGRTLGITAIGVVWGGTTAFVSPMFFLWLTPIFAGLLLAPLVVRWTSRADLGRALRARGILLVPSETEPPLELLPSTPDSREGNGPQPEPFETRTPRHMHEVERALFDLRRGRALCVTPAVDGAEAAVLCAPVEGLDPSGLDAMKRLGSGPVRLVVTARRAASMGIEVDGLDAPAGVSLGLNGETTRELFRLSSSIEGFEAGHLDARTATECEAAALDLIRYGRLLPAVVAVPARPEHVPELCRALDEGVTLRVKASHIGEMTSGAGSDVTVTHVSEARVPLEETENARFMLFREENGLLEHVAVLVGDQARWPDPLPVRLHSACLTGDLFGSLRCDCGEQLRGSLRSFVARGGGVLLYLQQEGRGIGLGNKLRAYALQEDGLDTIDADRVLGFGADERQYDAAVGMLKQLGVERVTLLTNNPEKVQALEKGGIDVVGREPLHGTLNRHNLPYVRAKVQRAGHWLGDMLHGDSSGA